jgi:hypothetical protein
MNCIACVTDDAMCCLSSSFSQKMTHAEFLPNL